MKNVTYKLDFHSTYSTIQYEINISLKLILNLKITQPTRFFNV